MANPPTSGLSAHEGLKEQQHFMLQGKQLIVDEMPQQKFGDLNNWGPLKIWGPRAWALWALLLTQL